LQLAKVPTRGTVQIVRLPVAILITLLPLQTQAQEIQLTLSCQVERAVNLKTKGEEIAPESFSAIVHMMPGTGPSIGSVVIEATTKCPTYKGTFTEQEVNGDCAGGIGSYNIHAELKINRINGAFEHFFNSPLSMVKYSGHCTPGKKLF
jgi:hypothetical protein